MQSHTMFMRQSDSRVHPFREYRIAWEGADDE